MKGKRYSMIVAVGLVFTVLVTGCSPEITMKSDSQDKGSLTYETDEGKAITMSNETEVPDGFPDDIPMPEAIIVTSSMSSEQSGNITVSIETELPFDDVVKLYQDYADKAGYKENLRLGEEGNYMFSGSRDNELFVFTLGLDLDNNKTVTGALVYEKKP